MAKPVVVFGLLGTTLDTGGKKRWQRWRPTVDLCRHEDLVVDRLELLHGSRWTALAEQVTEDIASISPTTKVRCHVLDFADPWDFESVYASLLDFARSYRFRRTREDYLVHITTGTHVAQICLYLLVESRHVPGQLIQTSPPPRGTAEPGEYRVIDLDLSRYDLIASRFAREQAEGLSFLKQGIATRNAAYNAVIERLESVALRSKAPVLLTGPTGVGKTRLARRVFELRANRGLVRGRFVEVNCATLRGDTAMSSLFGHVRGAFTGASSNREGLLRSGNEGVVFLDEIGELGRDEQAMLLRAIEDGCFTPVGSDREVSSDFQLLAGTNRDLRAAVRTGTFREDLLARLDLWTFELPPLRRRPEDIEPNLEYEVESFMARHGEQLRFTRDARTRFVQFATAPESAWLGNFRDFAGAVERMGTLAHGGRITPAVVDEEIQRLRAKWSVTTAHDGAGQALLERALDARAIADLDLFDKAQLTEVVRVCQGAPTLAAAGRQLFAATRKTRSSRNDSDRLRKYLARFDLEFRSLPKGAE